MEITILQVALVLIGIGGILNGIGGLVVASRLNSLKDKVKELENNDI